MLRAVLLALLAIGCTGAPVGSGGNTTGEGTTTGASGSTGGTGTTGAGLGSLDSSVDLGFPVRSAVARFLDADGGGFGHGQIDVLGTEALLSACPAADAGSAGHQLRLEVFGGAGSNAVVEGTYPLLPSEAPSPDGGVFAFLGLFSDDAPSGGVLGGTVTLSSITGTHVSGSFAGALADGGAAVAGSFDVPVCQ